MGMKNSAGGRLHAWMLIFILALTTIGSVPVVANGLEDDQTVPPSIEVPRNQTEGVAPAIDELVPGMTGPATPTPTPTSPSGSGSSDSGNTPTPTPAPTATAAATPAAVPSVSSGARVQTSVVAQVSLESVVVDNVSQVTVSTSQMTSLFDKALADAIDTDKTDSSEETALPADENDDEADAVMNVVEIAVTVAADARSVKVSLPANALQKLAREANAGVKLQAGIGELTFSPKALLSMTSEETEEVNVSISRAETKALPKAAQEMVANRPVYDFSVSAGGKQVSDFGGATVQISVPYVLGEDESPESIVVFFISDEGELIPVNGSYDPETGHVFFETTHFSKYVVSHRVIAFKDVPETAEYATAVRFIAARNITLGDGQGHFMPDRDITRGEFMAMLTRAYGIVADEADLADNFADSKNAFYSAAVASAKKLGITKGVGANRFNPNASITRQEMLVLVKRTLDVLEKSVPQNGSGVAIMDFEDHEAVADWATDVYKLFSRKNQLLVDDGMLNAEGAASRSELADLLYRMLK